MKDESVRHCHGPNLHHWANSRASGSGNQFLWKNRRTHHEGCWWCLMLRFGLSPSASEGGGFSSCPVRVHFRENLGQLGSNFFRELSSRQSIVVICPAETAERWKGGERSCFAKSSWAGHDDDELRFWSKFIVSFLRGSTMRYKFGGPKKLGGST